MAHEKLPRWWRRLAFSVLIFGLLDFAVGTLLFRFAPYKPDNRFYRQLSPICHHELKPNTAAWAGWGPYRYRVYTNSLGFRDTAVRQVSLVSDAWRVVLMGDSFTEGLGYAYEDTFAGILHARLAPRGIDVLNAGVSSYSPVIYYRRLKNLIEEVGLHVDEVIVFLDISDIQDEALYYTLSEDGRVVDPRVVSQPRNSEKPADATAPGWSPLTGWEKLKLWLREHFLSMAIADLVEDRFLSAGVDQSPKHGADPLGAWQKVFKNERGNWTHDARVFADYGEKGLARAAHSMELLRDLARSHDVRLTVVVYPWPNQIAAGDRDSKQVEYWRTWTASHGVGFINLFDEFMDGRDPAVVIPEYYIEGDSHFNAAGHQRVAAAMLQRFQWVTRH